MNQVKTYLFLLVFIPVMGYSHGDISHNKEKPASSAVVDSNTKAETKKETTEALTSNPVVDSPISLSDFSFADFPTLHPLIVHIPVTLIPMALLILGISFFTRGSQLIYISAGLTFTGLIGGLVAAFPLHPHTTSLPEAAYHTLKKHDLFAYSTLGLTALALILLLLLCVPRFQNQLIKALGIVFLLLATTTVAITGHYGGTLVYVHGVGAQGKYLEK